MGVRDTPPRAQMGCSRAGGPEGMGLWEEGVEHTQSGPQLKGSAIPRQASSLPELKKPKTPTR